VLKSPFNLRDLRVVLGAASDRVERMKGTGDSGYQERLERGRKITRSDRFVFWLSNHYMILVNFLLLLYVGLPFLAPVFMKIGQSGAARVIYTIYSPLCHQLAFRSFFLFGEQAYYPRALAQIPA